MKMNMLCSVILIWASQGNTKDSPWVLRFVFSPHDSLLSSLKVSCLVTRISRAAKTNQTSDVTTWPFPRRLCSNARSFKKSKPYFILQANEGQFHNWIQGQILSKEKITNEPEPYYQALHVPFLWSLWDGMLGLMPRFKQWRTGQEEEAKQALYIYDIDTHTYTHADPYSLSIISEA